MKITALLLPVMCLLPVVAHGGALDDILARGVLRVAVKNEGSLNRAEHNDPAHFQKRGFELDLARAITQRILGDETKAKFETFKRRQRLPAVADGTVDLGISMFSINEEDQALVDFSEPYFEGGLAVVQKGKSTVQKLADLNGMKVVALDEKMNDPAGELQRLAAVHDARIEIERVPAFQEGIDAVESGSADALVSESANLDAYIADGHADLKRSPLLSHKRFAVAVRKGNADLLKIVNEVIADLKKSGRLDAMLKKWKLVSK